MTENDRLAIAAHLHVLQRRNTGRVTDTEWLASNADYARAIIQFARQHAQNAQSPQNASFPELLEWATRLENAWLEGATSAPGVPLVQRAGELLRQHVDARKYVGPLR